MGYWDNYQKTLTLKNCEKLDKPVTTSDIKSLLATRFRDRSQFLAIPEMRPSTGYAENVKYIDFWVMNCYPSKGYGKTSFEIKVSRGDFLKEIKNPLKRRLGLALSNQFYFIAPVGLIKPEEVPPECGLIEVWWTQKGEWGALLEEPRLVSVQVIDAPIRDPNVLSWGLLASIGRRLAKLEEVTA